MEENIKLNKGEIYKIDFNKDKNNLTINPSKKLEVIVKKNNSFINNLLSKDEIFYIKSNSYFQIKMEGKYLIALKSLENDNKIIINNK